MIDEIKRSQQNILKGFEEHNTLVNKYFELTQQLKTETKVNVVKVKDPIEEIKKVKEEFDSEKYIPVKEIQELIKNCFSSQELKYSSFEKGQTKIARLGWIEQIVFKNCKNIKSISLHFQSSNDIIFKYIINEDQTDYTLFFGSLDSICISNKAIQMSILPLNILPYQDIYFTVEKIDETKVCTANMLYKFCNPPKLDTLFRNKQIIFNHQNGNFAIGMGHMSETFNNYNTLNISVYNLDVYETNKYLNKIIDILALYESNKISAYFKDIFSYIFNRCIEMYNEGSISIQNLQLKEKILKVRDIRWLLFEMEKYPEYFQFTEDDLLLMKENGASRDNIYLVKKRI
jgi:hypothetical protein